MLKMVLNTIQSINQIQSICKQKIFGGFYNATRFWVEKIAHYVSSIFSFYHNVFKSLGFVWGSLKPVILW